MDVEVAEEDLLVAGSAPACQSGRSFDARRGSLRDVPGGCRRPGDGPGIGGRCMAGGTESRGEKQSGEKP